jgi:hypothetical protein
MPTKEYAAGPSPLTEEQTAAVAGGKGKPDRIMVTTMAVGEEDRPITTLAIGEEEPVFTTLALGEEEPCK